MSVPTVVAVNPGSAGARAGLVPGDELLLINGIAVRDIIQYRQLVDEAEVEIVVRRGGLEHDLVVEKPEGSPLGIEVQSALFDQLRTCDNHCSFCFIYQLPPGLRPSLYEKDDDYRLSFLYGNFTTLTRFTEADLERVITEGLSPLNVSIHATDPDIRADLLRNRRGATSLRWLRALLDHGVEVHGQLVVCPGVNDGATLDDLLVPAFATVREAAKRSLGQRHFDVQMIGGMVLHKGDIAEMKTGEGKTLVATLPVYLNALAGNGVHVVTVNDYLARRDSEWMGQVYRFLGLTTGVIVHGMSDEQRLQAYAADVTYGTNNEVGFDYLRDNMKLRKSEMVQRGHGFAIVDEVDSILIDEARTPLIISGPLEDKADLYTAVDALMVKMTAEDYELDEKQRQVSLNEAGNA